MYETRQIDISIYENVYEYPIGRIEYNLRDMPETYQREDEVKFEYKRCISEPDMHFGEMTAYKAAQKIGIPCCKVELYKSPYYNKPDVYEIGAISHFDLSSDDSLISADSLMYKYYKKNKLENDYMPDIDSIFDAVYEKFRSEERPFYEFLKFKRDFISMLMFDLTFGNYDRGPINWFLRKNNKTGEIDLYPMFDNEAILGFSDEILEDTSYIKIANFNNIRESKVTIKKDREKRRYTDFREMYKYLLEKYTIETEFATRKINRFTIDDLNEILDNLPGISDKRKDFTRKNYLYRKMTMDRIFEDYLERKQKDKIKGIIAYDDRLSS